MQITLTDELLNSVAISNIDTEKRIIYFDCNK